MKKFILKILIIIAPVLIIFLTMEIALRNIPNDYKYKENYLNKNSGQIETLMLGASNGYYGLNPTYFEGNTFNACHISQSLCQDYEILKKYSNRLTSLKNVIITVTYSVMFADLETGNEAWRIKNYVIYYHINPTHTLEHSSEFLSQRLDLNMRRILSFYKDGKTEITCSDLGWGENYNSKNAQDLIESGKTAALRHRVSDIHGSNAQNMLKRNSSYLNSIIELCEQYHVNIYLLIAPTSESYRKNLNSEQMDITNKTIKDIVSRHSNSKYINLLDDKSFLAKDYYDADHLNEIGAEKLSKLMNELITH